MYDYSNLLGAMRQRGITQKSLAKSIGKSEATINRKFAVPESSRKAKCSKYSRLWASRSKEPHFIFLLIDL